ncbi:MAG: flagellar hook protein FlgE [Hydrogenophilaceae bacterium]|nr:flagellar hook protein FlgE [Hydrogenophilaceae bacterium]
MSFQQGLSGLSAAADQLDVIGNNVANSNTVGFKRAEAQFSDVYATSLSGTGGSQVGIGTQLAAVVQQFSQGKITSTENPLDVAINGNGFFRLSNNGATTYTRNGQFHLDSSGYIVTSTGKRLTGYSANVTGALDTSAPRELQLSTADRSPQITTEVNALLNLDSRQSALPSAGFDINDPTTFHHSTSVSIFDSLGNPHVFSTYYMKTGAGTWDVFGAVDGVQTGAGPVGTINFGTDGFIDTGTTSLPFTISATVTTGATSPFAFDMGFSGTTQFGSNFSVNAVDQDGFASGRLTGFNISPDGVIQGRYTNGQSAVLGQVVIVNFANPQGLEALGDNGFAESGTSGTPLVGTPGTGTLGVLQSSAVEDSNVDLTAELVAMITAQRVYQANAQTIKTQDQVMQTLVNMR